MVVNQTEIILIDNHVRKHVALNCKVNFSYILIILQTSMLFDVRIGGEFDGQVTHYQPVLAPLPIETSSIDVGEIVRPFNVI